MLVILEIIQILSAITGLGMFGHAVWKGLRAKKSVHKHQHPDDQKPD